MKHKLVKAAQRSTIYRKQHKSAKAAQWQLNAAQVGGGSFMQRRSAKEAQASPMQHKSARAKSSTSQFNVT
jgi:hypothetical protein